MVIYVRNNPLTTKRTVSSVKSDDAVFLYSLTVEELSTLDPAAKCNASRPHGAHGEGSVGIIDCAIDLSTSGIPYVPLL